jgi:hypothetical protein
LANRFKEEGINLSKDEMNKLIANIKRNLPALLNHI